MQGKLWVILDENLEFINAKYVYFGILQVYLGDHLFKEKCVKMKDIKQFLIKPTKKDKFPKNIILFYFNGQCVYYNYATYDQDGLVLQETKFENQNFLVNAIKKNMFKAKLWIVGSSMYEMLCWQGLFNQIELGLVKLPKKINDDGIEVLSQALVTNEPTIIDLIVNKQKVHCVDLLNWGITKVESLSDCCMKLQQWFSLIKTNRMGSAQDTAAGQGLTRYKRRDLPEYPIFAHQVMEVRKLERESWYAGRCEADELGLIKDERWHFDRKSQYANFGLTKKFPTRLVDYSFDEKCKSGNTDISIIKKHLDCGLQVIAKVELELDLPMFPLRIDNITIFPTGNLITVLAYPELYLAIINCKVKRIFEWSLYECDYIFKKNSEWFIEARRKLDEQGLSEMAGSLKLSQNSGYGNIGRRKRKWIDFNKVTDIRWGERVGRHPKTGEICMFRYIDGVNQYLDMTGEPDTSIPSIPSTMFSYGRVDMWHLICKAGIGNQSYKDTDGIIVNRKGKENLLTLEHNLPARPGELVIREYSHDEVFKDKSIDIRGVKHYRFGDTWRQAGVPSNATRDMFGNVVFDQNTPFDISLRMSNPFIFKSDSIKRNWKEIYKHGRIFNGNKVAPFEAYIYKDKKTGQERTGIK
jgi:hypothetical protein